MINTNGNLINNKYESAFENMSGKTDIEKIMLADNYKYNQESIKYLGIAKEDLINFYTIKELRKKKTYKKLEKELENPKVGEVLIRGKLYSDLIIKIVKLAQEKKLAFKIIKDSELEGDIGLVLVKYKK